MKSKGKMKKIVSLTIFAAMLLTLFIPTNFGWNKAKAATRVMPANPRINTSKGTVWDIIYFGSRTNALGKGEKRKWRVLKVENGKALILSTKCYSKKKYNTIISEYLTDYYNKFTDEQKEAIIDRKVFLLSQSDVENSSYGFTAARERISNVLQYNGDSVIVENGAEKYAYDGWWLSNGYTVKANGDINTSPGSEKKGFRPAMWINLSSTEWSSAGVVYSTHDTGSHIHQYSSSITTAATCCNFGTRTYSCDCGAKYTETIAKNSSNHAGGTLLKNVSYANEKSHGYTGDTYCKGCGVKLSSGEVTHMYLPVIETKANCHIKGVKVYKCYCGKTQGNKESIECDKNNHDGKKVTKGYIAPTVDKEGYTGDVYCSGCNAILSYGKKLDKLKPEPKPEPDKPKPEPKPEPDDPDDPTPHVDPVKTKLTQVITTKKVKNIKYKTLKKKKKVVKLDAKTSGNGVLVYKVIKTPKKAKKFIKVSQDGKITFKKKAKKGTYKVKIIASETSICKSATKVITIKIKK